MVNSNSHGTRNGTGFHPADETFPREQGRTPRNAGGPETVPDPLAEIAAHFAEAREFLSHFLTVKADLFRLHACRIALWGLAGFTAAIAGLTAIITAVALLINGFAGVLAEWFGGRLWAGELVAGSLCLCMAALAAWFGVRKVFQVSHQRMVAKYDRRRCQQQFTFGYDASRRAAREHRADGDCAPGI